MSRPVCTPLLALSMLAAASGTRASTVEYALDLPANQRLSFQLEFEVAFPGLVTVDADWSPSRVLVFRLDGVGEHEFRLAGPPPRRIEFEVRPEEIATDDPWLLTISGLPSREAAAGRLTIRLPDAPDAAPAPRAAEVEPVAIDPWRVAASVPTGIGRDRLRLYEAVERFRRQVVAAPVPDSYRWQDGALRYLAGLRDAGGASSALRRSTRTMLERVVEIVARLDELRSAEVRPLGETPTDPVSRRAWDRVRDPRFVPLEDDLDALMTDLHRGHAPGLESEEWFTNLLSCLIVCERHYEQRARLGDDRASNAELVGRQWQAVLLAVDALRALDALH